MTDTRSITCPFYAYSVSVDDVVYAPADPDDGRPTFQKVLTKSGNRTVRVVFDLPIELGNRSDEVLKGWWPWAAAARANSKYIAVNIPPVIELNAVRDYLIKCDAQWNTLIRPMPSCTRLTHDPPLEPIVTLSRYHSILCRGSAA